MQNVTLPEAAVTLTQAAADKLIALMSEQGVQDTHALRVFVRGGCSGMQYGIAFEGAPLESDVSFEQRGLRVVIDPESLGFVTGANIDFTESPMGGAFHIDNPNAVSGCGCGQGSAAGGCGGGQGGCGGGCG